MEYEIGILLHAINEKIDYLINKLEEAEKQAKEVKTGGK